jgi:anti-anti-sigma regulatory factor
MFTIDYDQARRLLTVRYAGHVSAQQVQSCLEQVRASTSVSASRLRVLTDLSDLDEMDDSCAADLGAIMDVLALNDIEKVVCVIPDPQKDIGFALMSQFHYARNTPMITCATMKEAMESLD